MLLTGTKFPPDIPLPYKQGVRIRATTFSISFRLKPMRLLQVLKTVGKLLGILLIAVFLIGSLIVFFYEKEIKQLVIQEVNKNLDTKITVEEFNFSVFRHFPLASIEMKNVFIEEAIMEKKKDTLLYAKRLSLLFKINDVFKKDVTIRKVLIYDGKLNILVDEKGHGNYHFLKNTESSKSSADVGIEKIGLSNVFLKYIDKKSNQDYVLKAKNAELSKVRAFAVRDALKTAGVVEDKIELKKPEELKISGSNAEARRVEVTLQ